MGDIERRVLSLLAALAAENARLLALLALGHSLRWCEGALHSRRVVV